MFWGRPRSPIGVRKTWAAGRLFNMTFACLMGNLRFRFRAASARLVRRVLYWVDPQSLDFIRLESRAVDIPSYLPLEETSKVVNYARTQIGEYTVLLAQQADLHMLETRGEESYDRVEFTHCRAFSVQSAIRFDLEPQSDTAKPSSPDSPRTLAAAGGPMETVPALLPVTVQLITAITDNDAVGTLIEAKVSGDVVRKGKIIIPDGSPVRGRIRRLERSGTGKDFIVGLEFTEVQVRGGPLRFYADLLWMDKRPEIRVKAQW